MGKQFLIGILLVLVCRGAGADASSSISSNIYVERLESGAVRFTDQPQRPDAEVWQTEMTQVTDITMPVRKSAEQHALDARAVEILSPHEDEAIRSNRGQLNIRVKLDAPQPADSEYTFLLNDEFAATNREGALLLDNVDRGTHSLQVRLMDAEGEVLAQSDAVRFHMLRYAIPSR
ncbi:MAG: hypothetical protein OXF72_05685 [Gammaproteobacteria bacterium]|nr:hypothetical protein [Gammaproteobacteria bacterium]MCY4200939.1 hypothetical protein [Gammaproteobacteria bacterium]MCY4279074.1 hypothetical protein [Gammaproteobacteria bacterium]MCY4323411.1 hypothetical protein [Gammaproteobacteria bacterium]